MVSILKNNGHYLDLEMKKVEEILVKVACDYEGTLASESETSLSHTLSFCITPFSSLDCVSIRTTNG